MSTPPTLGEHIERMVGEKGFFLFGIMCFSFLDANGEEKYAWISVEEPTLGQVAGMLSVVQHQILRGENDV